MKLKKEKSRKNAQLALSFGLVTVLRTTRLKGMGVEMTRFTLYVNDEKLTIKIFSSSIVLFVFMFEVWDSFYVSVVRNFKDILLLDRPELLFSL